MKKMEKKKTAKKIVTNEVEVQGHGRIEGPIEKGLKKEQYKNIFTYLYKMVKAEKCI